jgi:transposase-like protein
MIICPSYQSDSIKLNGYIYNGKQNQLCKKCVSQFVLHAENKVITQQQKALVDKLLLERISLAGIARALEVSQVWLQGYISKL